MIDFGFSLKFDLKVYEIRFVEVITNRKHKKSIREIFFSLFLYGTLSSLLLDYLYILLVTSELKSEFVAVVNNQYHERKIFLAGLMMF